MHHRRIPALVGLCLLAGPTISPGAAQHLPPDARRGDQISNYHGIRVADPYRWMEEMGSDAVREWAMAQDRYARDFTAAVSGHDALVARVGDGADHERYLTPIRRGERYFYARVNSSFTRLTLLVRDGRRGSERVVVDPAVQEAAGLAIDRSFWPSPDGRVLAYGVSAIGSRWMEVRFRNVETGVDLPDVLVGLQGALLSNLTWAADGSGVWYDAFALPADDARRSQQLTGSRVAFHRMGTAQRDDEVVLRAQTDDEVVLQAGTDDGRWIVGRVLTGRQLVRMVAIDARNPESRPIPLLAEPGSATFRLVGSAGDELWFYTNDNAANGRVIGMRVQEPRRDQWRSVIPEQDAAIDTWMGVDAVGQGLVAGFRREGLLEIRYFEPGAARGRVIPLAEPGSIWFGVSGQQGVGEFYYLLSGFANPGTVFAHDLASRQTTEFLVPKLGYDPGDFVTRQVFYRGPAGDRIPMYLAHHASVKVDGTAPVMMYGYGFLNWPASPWFRAHMAEWFRMGGVFALPALRGGGEFGAEWAQAGIGVNRQNAIDDFVAAAEWLIDEGYASPERLIAETNSAGATVVGAAIVQRPDLFGAALLAFPLLDVLRYHEFTGGRRWAAQLGTVADVDEARALIAYSPVHNVTAGMCHPPTLVLPGEMDETTPPFHAYKFVAALRDGQSCEHPVLLRVAWGAGHGYGRDQETTIGSFADQLAFVRRVLPPGTAWRR